MAKYKQICQKTRHGYFILTKNIDLAYIFVYFCYKFVKKWGDYPFFGVLSKGDHNEENNQDDCAVRPMCRRAFGGKCCL